jgi:hypothetical protein
VCRTPVGEASKARKQNTKTSVFWQKLPKKPKGLKSLARSRMGSQSPDTSSDGSSCGARLGARKHSLSQSPDISSDDSKKPSYGRRGPLQDTHAGAQRELELGSGALGSQARSKMLAQARRNIVGGEPVHALWAPQVESEARHNEKPQNYAHNPLGNLGRLTWRKVAFFDQPSNVGF